MFTMIGLFFGLTIGHMSCHYETRVTPSRTPQVIRQTTDYLNDFAGYKDTAERTDLFSDITLRKSINQTRSNVGNFQLF